MLSVVNFTQAKNSYSFILTDELDQEYCEEYKIEIYSKGYYDILSRMQEDDLDNLAWETKSISQSNELIAIAKVGLWNGKRIAYCELGHPENLREIIAKTNSSRGECELGKVILNENRDIAYSMHHHDGTNYIVIRERRNNISEENWRKMRNAIYNQDIEEAEKLIAKCTKKTGKYIKHLLN